ncbi:hypothetical protein [Chroococcidiopsis sp. CCMEE 29]|uniref:hypothetical protein n=1 Tax=Chroococcidiopsis sp. CCMEE 29 TaxID=155894 RepID=UPI00201FD55B|nr:hypothetical protein [Chroococcidiopsis sp. CCMEE 29]
MTPEAIRIVSQLRREFYSLFATAMEMPVSITNGSSYASNSSMASWIDRRRQLNYVCVYAHTAPDELVPERPFILRVAINKGAGVIVAAKREKDCRGFNQSWHFELTLLPEEILDFLPWIVSFVKSHEKCSTSFVLEPPHPFDFKMSNVLLFHEAWTQKAWQQLSNSLVVEKEVSEVNWKN